MTAVSRAVRLREGPLRELPLYMTTPKLVDSKHLLCYVSRTLTQSISKHKSRTLRAEVSFRHSIVSFRLLAFVKKESAARRVLKPWPLPSPPLMNPDLSQRARAIIHRVL